MHKLTFTQWNSLILIQRSPAGSERGLPFAQDGIRTSRADAWNQDWEWMGRHWGATLISEKLILIVILYFINICLDYRSL